jgi:hypothetical protein
MILKRKKRRESEAGNRESWAENLGEEEAGHRCLLTGELKKKPSVSMIYFLFFIFERKIIWGDVWRSDFAM